MEEIKRRAYRAADLEVLPRYLADVLKDRDYWRERLAQVKAEGIPWRIKAVEEIVAVIEADARQINRRIQAWQIG